MECIESDADFQQVLLGFLEAMSIYVHISRKQTKITVVLLHKSMNV